MSRYNKSGATSPRRGGRPLSPTHVARVVQYTRTRRYYVFRRAALYLVFSFLLDVQRARVKRVSLLLSSPPYEYVDRGHVSIAPSIYVNTIYALLYYRVRGTYASDRGGEASFKLVSDDWAFFSGFFFYFSFFSRSHTAAAAAPALLYVRIIILLNIVVGYNSA